MKLSWRDLITTALLIAGGAIVYAKFYDYSWAVIGSWRSAVAVLTGIGVAMVGFSRFDIMNMSWLNITETVLGFAVGILAIVGMAVTSEPTFYVVAGVLGVLWLLDTARHARHSLISEDTTSTHHTAPAH